MFFVSKSRPLDIETRDYSWKMMVTHDLSDLPEHIQRRDSFKTWPVTSVDELREILSHTPAAQYDESILEEIQQPPLILCLWAEMS